MLVMEAAARSQMLQPPNAELVGLQFGLATSDEILGFSVIERRNKDPLSNLVDPRLGLPAEDDRCATCGGTNYDECTGHFGHLRLTQPIFHPSHMRLVQRVLQKICLACGVPKVKKKKKLDDEAVYSKQRSQQRSQDSAVEDSNGEREPLVIVEANLIEKDADGRVILLSSSDEEEEIPRDILRVTNGPIDFSIGSTSESGIGELPRLRSHKSNEKAHANGSSHFKATTNGRKKSASVKSQPQKGLGKIYKGKPAGLDVLNADTLRTARSSKTCRHCSPGYPDYRSIIVKILPVKGRKKDDVTQILLLEVQGADREDEFDLPQDFWTNIKVATSQDDEAEVPKTHVLTPSEALAILKKIPESAIGKLGMNELVARPEGLIMKCVPVPPNCTRTTDWKHVNNTIAVRFGTDRVTRTLHSLVTELNRINKTRSGKAMQRAQRDESKALQILTAEYLREKGAPKAVPGKEPLKKDRNGRFTKQDDHRWTKEWLTQNILGKDGNYTARAVIAGDPSLGIEEIGVPWVIVQKLTIPERATEWNCTKLQEYVDRTQLLQGSGKPSATRIERNGEAFQVWANSTHKVQIGDVVHRNIQDGDYVYANRPPSVHKHSLMALRVRVTYGLVLTVNPLICAPFKGDFDGDAFHIFVPQSLQAIAEQEQLMAVSQQIVSDYGPQPLLGLTQDTLLAAHLLTASKLLVDKALMDQLCLWSSKQPPEAAIVKSPKGGPFWTGEQVFGLTLPADLELGTPDEDIFIKGGQITKWNDATKALRLDNNGIGIASALCNKLGPLVLIDHLNTASGLLHAWLQVQGFSTGLTDFQVTNNRAERQQMLEGIFEEHYANSIRQSIRFARILDPKVPNVDKEPGLASSSDGLTENVRFLEQTAQHLFRTRESDAENIVLKYAEKSNSLLLMVKSGSKGSRGKLLQQIAGMGLQLYKGKHLLPFSGSHSKSLLDWWEDKGLVRSSLVDGLKPRELFNHVIADRTGIFRKHLEVIQPGTLFKNLMMFLRDLHVMYDGSVRSQFGKKLVQFCYGGAVAVRRNQYGMEYPTAPAEGSVTWEEDRERWRQSALAGEPVGVLAATAFSQPAYDLMLDAPNLNGPFKPRPLELVQETLYPRQDTVLKPIDRCVVIRLFNCRCTDRLCLEQRVLDVQAQLERVTLKTVAQSSAIEFWNMEDFRVAGPTGEELRLGSPWLGHIKLSLEMMKHHGVVVEDIVTRLRQKFSGYIKNVKKNPMGQIFFCSSTTCGISNGLCLHFSPKLPSKMQNQRNEEIYNAALQTLLMKIRGITIPGLLESTVKGDERLESVRIVREDPSWTIWHRKFAHNQDLNEELVLEIIVSPTKSKSKRSMAWSTVKQACLPFMDMVDWNRSMPYSVQEIRHALGVEVAYQTVLQRLGLVLQKTAPNTHPVHAKLIADLMTFSGDANGFNYTGFQDMNKSTGISAPFTEAAVHKPIRTLLDAAAKGATDSVEDVMASCVWGKEAPLGTGSNFDLFWQPSKDFRRIATSKKAEKDVHMIWKDLDEKCIPDKVIPPSPTHSLPGLSILPEGDMDLDDGAGFSPQHASTFGNIEDDTWRSSHPNNGGNDESWGNPPVGGEDGGGWGAVDVASDGGGWGAVGVASDGGGWGAVGVASDGGGWGAVGVASDNNKRGGRDQDDLVHSVKGHGGKGKSAEEGGWGVEGQGGEDKSAEEGGWGSLTKERGVTADAWDDNNKEDAGGRWGGSATETSTGNEGGWGNEKSISENVQNENRVADAQGGWERGAVETRTEVGGFDGIKEARTVSDQRGWDSISNDVAGTTADAGNWGANSVQERSGGGGGWDSVSAEVVKVDGWDSLAGSQTDHIGHRHESHAENSLSQGRYFRGREEGNGGSARTWNSRGGGRRQGRGRFERGHDSSRSTPVSGANEQILGTRQGNTSWGDGGNTQQSSCDDVTTNTTAPTGRDGDWSEPAYDCANALPKSPKQGTATESAVEWGELNTGPTQVDAWASLSAGNGASADGWDAVPPESNDVTSNTSAPSGRDGDWSEPASRRHGNRGRDGDWSEPASRRHGNRGRDGDWSEPSSDRHSNRGRGRYSSAGAMHCTFRQTEIEPECKEIDDIVKSMRQILWNQNNETGGRLSDEDDEAVQAVLSHHPKYSEKAGCGIAYIKVDKSPDYPDVRCFWLVRTDGSETDFSYRKCLREKVVLEFPAFVDRYDELYGKRRPVAPLPNLREEDPPAAQAEERNTQADPLQETFKEADPPEEPAPTTQADSVVTPHQ